MIKTGRIDSDTPQLDREVEVREGEPATKAAADALEADFRNQMTDVVADQVAKKRS